MFFFPTKFLIKKCSVEQIRMTCLQHSLKHISTPSKRKIRQTDEAQKETHSVGN